MLLNLSIIRLQLVCLSRKAILCPDKCVVCQYYKYFFEPDDKKLEKIFEQERNGTLLAGEHKKHLAATVNEYLHKLKLKRERMRPKLEKFMLKG